MIKIMRIIKRTLVSEKIEQSWTNNIYYFIPTAGKLDMYPGSHKHQAAFSHWDRHVVIIVLSL